MQGWREILAEIGIVSLIEPRVADACRKAHTPGITVEYYCYLAIMTTAIEKKWH